MNLPDTLVAEMMVFLHKWQKNDEAGAILTKLKKVVHRANETQALRNREEAFDRELAREHGDAVLPAHFGEWAGPLETPHPDRKRSV
jgi:hypothetical protein